MTYSYREDLITDRQTVGARPLESIQEVETFADSDLDNPTYQIMVSVSDGTYADADNKSVSYTHLTLPTIPLV